MIEFIYNTPFVLDNEKSVKDWLHCLAYSEGFEIKNLHYNYVSVEKIQSINNQFLNHDYPTDVIAFDYCEGKLISGEVFICQTVVNQNAIDHSQTIENETLRVIIHGVLHCMGYNDKTSEQLQIMRNKEEEFISLFHVKQNSHV